MTSSTKSDVESSSLSDLFAIAGKTALITGGASGIGRMISEGLVRAGGRVYITSRNRESCRQAERELSDLGECVAIQADISTPEGRTALIENFAKHESQLHILINNAGINHVASLSEHTDNVFEEVMEVNVTAIFSLVRGLMEQLEAAATPEDPARVINVGSIDGMRVPLYTNFAYCASKAALHHLTKVLAVHLGPRRVTVNAVAPGLFESKMTESVLQHHKDTIVRFNPLRRIGEPSDMVGVTIFLSSKAGSYINGQIIRVDGGVAA